MLRDLIPVAAITVGPILALAPVVYALRRQCGRHVDYRDPHRPTRPAAAILARLAHEVDTGEIPRDLWGGVGRESALTADDDIIWQVSPATDRDLTGAFPVVRAA